MNKKAFTIIELLSAILIISLIASIGVISYSLVMKQVSNKVYQRYRDTMHAEAIYYVSNKYDQISWSANTARLTLTDLKIEPINNPKDSKDLCLTSYVDVTRSRDATTNILSMSYNVCLKCNDFDECKLYEN